MAVLASSNDNRGGDSWGYHIPGRGSFRGLGDIAPNTIKMYGAPIILAHTRKATQGAITKENAHPFEIGKIIGAHNGMISNHDELNRNYERTCAVDSMHLFHHLNEERPFSDISGYGAIEWINKEDDENKIYLCKMSAGDLAVYGLGDNTKNVQGIVWSSDEDHLKSALTAANLKAFPYKVNTGEVCFVHNGKYYVTEGKLELAPQYSNYHSWRYEYPRTVHMKDEDGSWSMKTSVTDADRAAFKEMNDAYNKDEIEEIRELWGIENDDTEVLSGKISDEKLQEIYQQRDEEEFTEHLMKEIEATKTDKLFIGDKFVDVKQLSKDDIKIVKKYTEETKQDVRDIFMPKDNVA